jgi:integrase
VTTEREKPKRPRGTGSVFQRAGTANLWIKYHRNGKPFSESAHTTKEKVAEKFLQQRLAEVSTGSFIGPRVERILVSELMEDLLLQYETGVILGQKSAVTSRRRWNKHLRPFFGHLRVVQVGTTVLTSYVQQRQENQAENGTINRELAILRRAFQRGFEATPQKVVRVPHFPRLAENGARQGFLEDAKYDKLAAECAKEGLWFRTAFAVASNLAWRKGEVLNLRVRQVDLHSGVIRLEQGTTKNGEGRVVKMTSEVAVLIEACIAGKGPEDYVLSREDGKRVKSFRRAWSKACAAAGVPGLLFHDLRRTGARNLRRLGVAEGTIMKIGGWKTRSVFERYNIVSLDDLSDAAARLDEKRRKAQENEAENVPEDGFSDSLVTVTQ